MATCTFDDWRLGPQVDNPCRQFDFTLFFEAIFLSAVPSALLLICLSARLWNLAGTRVETRGGILLKSKTVRDRTVGRSTGVCSTDSASAEWSWFIRGHAHHIRGSFGRRSSSHSPS
jgi:hypothetical protein